MRKAGMLIAAVGFLVLLVESGSSYVIYRHYASLHRAYYPIGWASVALLGYVLEGGGRHDEVTLSIDHAPLFKTDPTLGYVLVPGRYQVTEQRGGRRHRFTITVDDTNHRVTAQRRNSSARRIFIAGDSAMFGWGLNDEQTAPWLMQTRFPSWEVVDLSLTSYSTIHAMLQLRAADPPVGPDDILVLTYHPITNGFNVASAEMLSYLKNGFEQQLGDSELVRDMQVPIGRLVNGELQLDRHRLACGTKDDGNPGCASARPSPAEAMQISIKAFDAIMAAHAAHYVVAFLSGKDDDPVIAHLKNSGAVVADLRTSADDPDANDEVSIDEHSGPFWHHLLSERLATALLHAKLVD